MLGFPLGVANFWVSLERSFVGKVAAIYRILGAHRGAFPTAGVGADCPSGNLLFLVGGVFCGCTPRRSPICAREPAYLCGKSPQRCGGFPPFSLLAIDGATFADASAPARRLYLERHTLEDTLASTEVYQWRYRLVPLCGCVDIIILSKIPTACGRDCECLRS